MKIAFLRNETRREVLLARAFMLGMMRHGDKLDVLLDSEVADVAELDCDMVAIVGLKGHRAHARCMASGKAFLYLDKGYFYPEEGYASKVAKQVRNVQCWRVAVNETQPLEYLKRARKTIKRWDKFGPRPKPWRTSERGPIILAGSSMKYHLFNGLPHPTTYFEDVVREIKKYTNRTIHYRPKPSWPGAVPIEGTEFIPSGSFEYRVEGAHLVITHGSNAALIAMLMGIPSIILGNGVMRGISSTSLADVENPYLATDEEKLQLLANLAWSQYTVREFESGEAWRNIKAELLS